MSKDTLSVIKFSKEEEFCSWKSNLLAVAGAMNLLNTLYVKTLPVDRAGAHVWNPPLKNSYASDASKEQVDRTFEKDRSVMYIVLLLKCLG
jgi:hypothetical protein